MSLAKKAFFILTFLIIGTIVGYYFGRDFYNQPESTLSDNKNVIDQTDETFKCPYKVDVGEYAQYSKLIGEVVVIGKPEIIENPEVNKTNKPFVKQELRDILFDQTEGDHWETREFDVDNDGVEEKIISANVAMNHTPNIALIVKDGKIIFEKNGANVWIKEAYENNGFFFNETVDWNTGESKFTRYIPKDEGFIPIWTQTSCWVFFE